jgi:DNA-binding NarL/FixJ family response regulator
MMGMAYVHIMLVDDHPLVRDGLRSRLDTSPRFAVVAEASGADEALARVRSQEINLVLMDISLHGMNGIDLTRMLTSVCPHLAVIMLSMHDNAEYVTRSIEAGARGYVLKDAPAEEIIVAIDTVMSGGLYCSPALAAPLCRPSRGKADALTAREREVLKAIATERSSKHIARTLNISVRTIETHRSNIKKKLGIEGQAELIRYAVEQMIP